MKVHSTEHLIRFPADAGWSALLVSQIASEDAIVERRESRTGAYYQLWEGELLLEPLMTLVSKINHYRTFTPLPRWRYREYLSERLKGVKNARQT